MSDPHAKPSLQTHTEIISDALMRANTMKASIVIYIDKDDCVAVNYSCSRVQRLGMLTHVLFHELAVSVRDVDDYESDEAEEK